MGDIEYNGYFESLIKHIVRQSLPNNEKITRKRATKAYWRFREICCGVVKANPGKMIITEMKLGVDDNNMFHIYFQLNGDPKILNIER
jgi:hypothetical protein